MIQCTVLKKVWNLLLENYYIYPFLIWDSYVGLYCGKTFVATGCHLIFYFKVIYFMQMGRTSRTFLYFKKLKESVSHN
ncbi:hypothetical protein CISIN_1g038415mg [Citrus sinensis]|uniref:Uncharacterized protein n=1 Tax=Citrus sinensis TaxID=2711 RepID=A0A067GNV5_CITSI|nr:hypothetical protein CISIN_1g038415mg [Citrus sinensis]